MLHSPVPGLKHSRRCVILPWVDYSSVITRSFSVQTIHFWPSPWKTQSMAICHPPLCLSERVWCSLFVFLFIVASCFIAAWFSLSSANSTSKTSDLLHVFELHKHVRGHLPPIGLGFVSVLCVCVCVCECGSIQAVPERNMLLFQLLSVSFLS